MSEISDEEVDYGSFESIVNPATDSDHVWSTSEIDSQHLREKGILISKTTRAKISSQFMKECKPRMSKSRFQFAVH